MAIKIAGTEVISDDKRILNNESLPDIRPSLLLDFANSKTLDPRITFTRGSTATYWDGKTTAKAEENLFKYSQELDNSYWNGLRAVRTANQTTAPDGTNTADAINQASGEISGGFINSDNNEGYTSGVTYTTSIYAKPNGKNFLRVMTTYANGTQTTWFNLSTGSVGTSSSDHTSSIVDAGNGWYRCIVTATADSGGYVNFYISEADNTSSVTDDQTGYYAWGAQVEQRSSATAYTATTTSPIVKYQPTLQTAASGEARFDHDPVTGESKGLLIEEARTNLFNQSEDFTAGNWSVSQATLTQNVVAPDGTLTAWSFQESTATSVQHPIQYNAGTVSVGDVYTLSVFAKGAGRRLSLTSFGMGYSAFDLDGGEVDSVGGFDDATIEDVGNGWYRCSITLTKTNTNGNFYIITYSPTGHVYTGDGYSGLYLWGAQLEAGSFPTSYIPTSVSTVTRAADDAKINDVSEIFNPQEFTFYFEGKFLGRNTFEYYPRSFSFIDPSNAGQYSVGLATQMKVSGDNLTYFTKAVGGTDYQSTQGLAVDVLSNYKTAVSATTSQATVATNGASSGASVNEVYLPNRYTQMTIGGNSRYQDNEGMHVKKIAVYEKAFTSAQLVAMTEE